MISWKDVSAALEPKNYLWRTLRGVAKELTTTKEEVLRIINENESEVVKSSPSGRSSPLYTTRKHMASFEKKASSKESPISPSAPPDDED